MSKGDIICYQYRIIDLRNTDLPYYGIMAKDMNDLFTKIKLGYHGAVKATAYWRVKELKLHPNVQELP